MFVAVTNSSFVYLPDETETKTSGASNMYTTKYVPLFYVIFKANVGVKPESETAYLLNLTF